MKYQSIALSILIYACPVCAASEAKFDPAFLNASVSNVTDLSLIEGGSSVPPGDYEVDVYINGQFSEVKRVHFQRLNDADNKVVPVFTVADLKYYGLKDSVIAQRAVDDVFDITEVEGISINFEAGRQRLELSIPQTMMDVRPRGDIPESRWDDGINAVLLDYSLNYYNNNNSQGSSDSYFLNLNGGVNIGSWRYREYTTGSYDDKSRKFQWATLSRYVERPLRSLRSSMRIGDQNTSGEMFESIGTRSVTLASEQSMLPDSMQGFAPVIRGVASTNAVVTVYQNSYPIYETSVAPGAFELQDVTPVANSGELTVKIKEADGRVTQFLVPYSAVPVFVRQGTFKYDLTVGETRGALHSTPLLQGTMTYGLLSRATAYGGLQVARDYKAYLVGMGLDLGNIGAVSADVTQARSNPEESESNSGQSWRFLYAKTIQETGTNFQLAGYRYSTRGFRTLNEHLVNQMSAATQVRPHEFVARTSGNGRKENYQLTVSQRINDSNNIFINASRNTWWNQKGADTLVQAGHSTTFGNVTVSTFIGYNSHGNGNQADKNISVSLSIPLTVFGGRSASASYTTSQSGGKISHMAGLGGTAGDNDQLQYSMYDTWTPENNNNQGTVSGSWLGRRGNIGGSYSAGKDSRQLSANVHGGAILHSGGLTFSQPLGETNILVEAANAEDLEVANRGGIRTDSRGYAVVPSAMIYRENTVALNTESWSDSVELDESVRKVIPSRGAIVKASFPVNVGYKALVTLLRNGKFLPFGTLVRVKGKGQTGIVDEHGQVFLSGLPEHAELSADWGAGSSCKTALTLPKEKTEAGIHYMKAECK